VLAGTDENDWTLSGSDTKIETISKLTTVVFIKEFSNYKNFIYIFLEL
jgi:hypothetical protein